MGSQNFMIGAFFIALLSLFSTGLARNHNLLKEFSQFSTSSKGTKWALLVAGSNGYWNYRHQADICHAYHIFKRGGLKDENIIVFMYDDIAYNKENPRPGVIINNPKAVNFYPGVPKDYTGEAVNSENFYAVILGNKTATKGGSGKVLKTGPHDHIFIYYADHGAAGLLGMPNDKDVVYAKDLINVLIKKHASKSYKKMVIYVEACESGSIFDGLLPENLNIYVTTAANTKESSYATYCGDDVPVPIGYKGTCLGDVYSVSWMEDSDESNPLKKTLKQQYFAVKHRTGSTKGASSHVMQYGELSLSHDLLAVYLVANSSKFEGSHTYTTTAEPDPINTYTMSEPIPPYTYTKGEEPKPAETYSMSELVPPYTYTRGEEPKPAETYTIAEPDPPSTYPMGEEPKPAETYTMSEPVPPHTYPTGEEPKPAPTYTTAEPDPPGTYTTAEPEPPQTYTTSDSVPPPLFAIEQRDADLVYFKEKVRRAPQGSSEQITALKELNEVISHRKHVDQSVEAIGKALFGEEKGPSLLYFIRPAGQVLVDDWDCLKAMVKTYEAHCGPLKTYGKKYARAFANICNTGVYIDQMDRVSTQVCNSEKQLK